MLIISWLATTAAICCGCLGIAIHYYHQGELDPGGAREFVSLAFLAVLVGFISSILETNRSLRGGQSWRAIDKTAFMWVAFPLLFNSGVIVFLLVMLYGS
jgi:hypothetical protein